MSYNAIVINYASRPAKYRNITNLNSFIRFCFRSHNPKTIFLYNRSTREYVGFYSRKRGLVLYNH